MEHLRSQEIGRQDRIGAGSRLRLSTVACTTSISVSGQPRPPRRIPTAGPCSSANSHWQPTVQRLCESPKFTSSFPIRFGDTSNPDLLHSPQPPGLAPHARIEAPPTSKARHTKELPRSGSSLKVLGSSATMHMLWRSLRMTRIGLLFLAHLSPLGNVPADKCLEVTQFDNSAIPSPFWRSHPRRAAAAQQRPHNVAELIQMNTVSPYPNSTLCNPG